jgi:signal transduction histidine kinase
MSRARVLLSLALLCEWSSLGWSAAPLAELSLDQLERRKQDIDQQLRRIATYSLGSGLGAIGYRSRSGDAPDRPEWIEISLGRTVKLDEIVLVPTIRRDTTNGFQADAFPRALRVFAGLGPAHTGTLIAEFTGDADLLPRIAPVVIPCGGLAAEWIRIEAVALSLRAFDGRYVFQLAEVLAFSGQENVALRRPVRSSSVGAPPAAPGWAESFVNDGVLPYLMAVAGAKGSVAFLTQFELGDDPTIAIDLGAVQRITRVHLHAIDQSDTVPQAFAGDFGLPPLLRIEGATSADFANATVLAEIRHETIYDVGPILMWTVPPADCRYVRLRGIGRSPTGPLYGLIGERFGFAEIEIFSGERNVALHRPVSTTFKAEGGVRQIAHLTDGMNYYGPILPVRTWLNQLATRHELERERPQVTAEIDRRHAAQRTQLTGLAWLAGLLALGVVGIALGSRLQRQRAIEHTRRRIAADLHDELGADLHAVGLLSDVAKSAAAADQKLVGLLQRMRALTARAGHAARHCTNLLEAPGLFGDLADDLRRASARLLADLEHHLEIAESELLPTLAPQRRIDLLLFYQECLTNILRHSGATRVATRLWINGGRLHLTVSDNGQGLHGELPASLQRRARLLGASLAARKSDAGGLEIDLCLKLRRFALFG